MSYASQDDLEARYPGELAQAGPTVAGVLDDGAIALALSAADEAIDRAMRVRGWTVPIPTPIPVWVVSLAVDLALYLATPTALASQSDFADRKARYLEALSTLALIAKGELWPALPVGSVMASPLVSSNERQFGRGSWA